MAIKNRTARSKKKAAKRTTRRTRSKHAPTPRGGRPRYEFDLDSVQRLVVTGCTIDDLAWCLGVSKSCMEKRIKDDPWMNAVVEKARADRRLNLRRAQTVTALKGNATMQIWLGKNELGQRDFKQLEVTGVGGGPLHIVSELRPLLERKLVDFILSRTRAAEAS